VKSLLKSADEEIDSGDLWALLSSKEPPAEEPAAEEPVEDDPGAELELLLGLAFEEEAPEELQADEGYMEEEMEAEPAAKAVVAKKPPRPPAEEGDVTRCFLPEQTEEDLSPEDLALLEEQRVEMKVQVEKTPEGAVYPMLSTFEELGVFQDYIFKSLEEMKITGPMPIQAQSLPIVLRGEDLIGIARTGSGKTLAFLLPAMVHVEAQAPPNRDQATPIVLILAPTRELVHQIAQEAGKLCEHSGNGASSHPRGIWAECVYGGKQRNEQLQRARGCSIIAATPGRLTDYLNAGDMTLDRTTYFVLDEADRMLDYGFQGDVEDIQSKIRKDRHMLFFSATWPPEVEELATSLCVDGRQPVVIRVGQGDQGAAATRPDIIQQVEVFDQDDWRERDEKKKAFLYAHIREVLKDPTKKMLVFVNNKIFANELRDNLYEEGFETDAMHGGRKQWDRDAVLARFKANEFKLLVATDVMGRGLDIPDITHVVIYDMGDVDDYVHRIGRTARGLSGLTGHALTLFEYNSKWPELPAALQKVLEDSGSPVPEDLARIAAEAASGEREVQERAWAKKKKKGWGGDDDWKKDDWKKDDWKKDDTAWNADKKWV